MQYDHSAKDILFLLGRCTAEIDNTLFMKHYRFKTQFTLNVSKGKKISIFQCKEQWVQTKITLKKMVCSIVQ